MQSVCSSLPSYEIPNTGLTTRVCISPNLSVKAGVALLTLESPVGVGLHVFVELGFTRDYFTGSTC